MTSRVFGSGGGVTTFLLVAGGLVLAGSRLAAVESDPEADIDAIFADLDSVRSPGCAVGVIRGGTLVYQRGYGMASLEHGVPIDENTVFYTGSVSNQFTAAAVTMAAREGYVSLNDDIRTWFPEISDYGSTITVRHLVHHTSGLRDYLGLMLLAGRPAENITTPERVLDLITRQQALNFAPGEQYLYSNTGYFLMAQLVERATGRSLRQYAHEKFFAPLSMRHTHFHDDRDEIVEARVAAYAAGDDGFIVNWSSSFDQVGSGGLLSTIEDLVAWDQSYYDDRLGAGFWDALQERGVLSSGQTLSYAFGLTIDEYGRHRRVQHGGSMFGYRAQLSRFPDVQLTVAVLCNLAGADPGARANQVEDLFLPREERTGPSRREERVREPIRLDPIRLTLTQLDAWAGEYEFVSGVVYDIARDGDNLVANTPNGPLTLIPVSDSEFRLAESRPSHTDSVVRFREVNGERSLGVEISGNYFTAIRVPTRVTDPARLTAWVGAYRSEELDATAVIRLEAGQLTYHVGSADREAAVVRGEASLFLRGLQAEGEFGDGGRVDTFVVNTGRVRGIRFWRTNRER
ncbi:MAG: serine hydrolase domain-containing protein [Acidobacteriota bacterium]|nr:serine hydrolase domain-containing protein [Acidobacteriota bacterium]